MDALAQLEIGFILMLQNLGAWLQLPMLVFTFLGNEFFFLLVMPALYWSLDPLPGFRSGMMLILSVGLNSCLKILFHTPRPFWVDGRVQAMSSEVSFGLPSGHSQNSASIWGIIAATVKKRWFTIMALILVFFIGISRIYLGMHYLHDVLAGWLTGLLLILVYLRLEKPAVHWLEKHGLKVQVLSALAFSLVIIGLGYLSLLTVSKFSLPGIWTTNAIAAGAQQPDPLNLEGIIAIAGVGFGFPAGYAWWRRKFGTFTITSTPIQRVLRYVLGLAGIAVLYFGLKMVFPEEPFFIGGVFRYLRYALIGLWVTALAPLGFKLLHLEK